MCNTLAKDNRTVRRMNEWLWTARNAVESTIFHVTAVNVCVCLRVRVCEVIAPKSIYFVEFIQGLSPQQMREWDAKIKFSYRLCSYTLASLTSIKCMPIIDFSKNRWTWYISDRATQMQHWIPWHIILHLSTKRAHVFTLWLVSWLVHYECVWLVLSSFYETAFVSMNNVFKWLWRHYVDDDKMITATNSTIVALPPFVHCRQAHTWWL